MRRLLERARSTELYRRLCALPTAGDGNLLERTSDEVAAAQVELLRWALELARPRVVLEVGTDKGLFPYLCSLLLEGIEVHTVDVRPQAREAVDLLNAGQEAVRCVFHEGDSRQVLPRLEVRPDFAWLDGGHATEAVLGDLLECYRLGVPYVAVDDTAYPAVARAVDYAQTHLPYDLVTGPLPAEHHRRAVLLELRPLSGPGA